MGLFIPVPNCAKVALNFTYAGQKVANIFHVSNDTPFDLASLALVSELFKDWWVDNMAGSVASDLQLDMVSAIALDTASSPGVENTIDLPVVGASAAPSLPNNVTFTVKWLTGFRGRSYRGRTYHVGLRASHVTNNVLTPTMVTAFTTVYQALLDDLDSTPYQLVVVSRYADNQPRTTGIMTPVSGFAIEANLDSQRRRLVGRGE